MVSTGGDYALPEESNFILNPGDIMSCLDVLVLSDNLFESDEMFNVRLVGLIDDRGFPVDSIDGVTLNPDLTSVIIEDSDGEITSNILVCVLYMYVDESSYLMYVRTYSCMYNYGIFANKFLHITSILNFFSGMSFHSEIDDLITPYRGDGWF